MLRFAKTFVRSVTRGRVTLFVSRFDVVQTIIDLVIIELEYLQGVGAGAGVRQSGERAVLEILRETSTDPAIVDAGANMGEYIRLAMDVANPAEIHAFEPQPQCIEGLEGQFPHGGVEINPVALSDSEGVEELFFDEEGSGLASFTQRDVEHHSIEFDNSITVQTTTLTKYWERNGKGVIDLLKVDVEGHELEVFAGASDLFDQGKIRACTFEFGGCNIDTRTFVRDYIQFFDSYGFNIYRITPSRLVKIDHYSESVEKFNTTNFLAARPDFISNGGD